MVPFGAIKAYFSHPKPGIAGILMAEVQTGGSVKTVGGIGKASQRAWNVG